MADTPHLTIPYLAEGQGTPYVTVNEGADILDLMVQPNVIDRDLATPPGSPTAGDRYLIAGSPTGDWAGKAGQLTTYNNSAWVFSGAPVEGWEVWVQDENIKLRYDGAAWSAAGAGGGGVFTDLTDTPANYTGDGGKLVKVNSGETALEFEQPPYDVGVYVPGTFSASQVLVRWKSPRAIRFPSGLTNSQGVSGTAATAQTDFDIQKNGGSVGTARWAASATAATFIMASETAFAAGDVLSIVAPATPDSTIADVGITLAATRD